MKLSTRSRYGVRALVELATSGNNTPITSRELAKRQDLSVKYLEQLLTPLKQAGLVKSLRGPRGGYFLGRPAADLTLAEVVRVLEGPIAMVDCVSAPETCPRSQLCAVRDVWEGMSKTAEDYLSSITLAHLAREFPECDAKPLS